MRKAFLAIAAAMMGIFFVGCNNGKEVEPDRDIANKIIGKWIYAENDGKVLPTNEKVVYEFVSATHRAWLSSGANLSYNLPHGYVPVLFLDR